MKRFPYLFISFCSLLPVSAAGMTVSGSADELEGFFAPKIETIELSGVALASLTPTRPTVHGYVEIDGERVAALRRALDDFSVSFADSYQDPTNAIEIQKLKRFTYRAGF